MKRIVGASFLLFFALLWGGAVVAGDVMVGRQLLKQHAAGSWPAVEGTVTRSDLRSWRGRKGGTGYMADIEYAYAVNGRGFRGDRVAFGADVIKGSRPLAEDWLARFPRDAHPQVRYNPKDPAESALLTEFLPGHAFMVLFLLPFNAGAVGFFGLGVASLRRAITRPLAGGLRILEESGATLIRVDWWSPLYTGLAVVGSTAFLAALIIGMGWHAWLPVDTLLAIIAGVLVAGLLAAALAYTIGPRSDKYIVLDPDAGTLTIPATGGKKQAITLEMGDITSITTREERRGKSSYYYLCVHTAGGENAWRLNVAKDRLDGLAEYLRERLGLVKNS